MARASNDLAIGDRVTVVRRTRVRTATNNIEHAYGIATVEEGEVFAVVGFRTEDGAVTLCKPLDDYPFALKGDVVFMVAPEVLEKL